MVYLSAKNSPDSHGCAYGWFVSAIRLVAGNRRNRGVVLCFLPLHELLLGTIILQRFAHLVKRPLGR